MPDSYLINTGVYILLNTSPFLEVGRSAWRRIEKEEKREKGKLKS